ncbi:hypothetical protein K678_10746 [Magnetospirillum fulvum MGU-K5]|uniref:Methyl-accepting chemotaxis protein n=1 Tax=Magnetospirillum fulvum MGU-K5 TaxID=1316936 RepID=S9TSJ2_MAGFU|nr:hypothetical protein K678_10746 [Magnetospirillum fulvum MGU-K5]
MLTQTTEALGQRLRGAGDVLRRQTEQVVATADQAEASVSGVAEAVKVQSQALSRVADDSTEVLRAFGAAIQQNAVELGEAAQQVFAQSQTAGDALRAISRDFEEGSNKTAIQVTTAGDMLRAGIRELTAAAERITGQVRAAGDGLRRHAVELQETTDRTGAKLEASFEMVRTKSNDLGITGDRLAQQAESFTTGFSRQIEQLVSASKLAEIRTQQLEEKRALASVENFLQSAAFIVEKLQSLSVDIARIFNANIDEKAWRDFHAGDQSIFVRKILKNLDRHQIASIRTRFEEDGEFRDYATRYLAEFEALLNQARNSDHMDVLTGTFTSSEVGKLYLVLARALGRLE